MFYHGNFYLYDPDNGSILMFHFFFDDLRFNFRLLFICIMAVVKYVHWMVRDTLENSIPIGEIQKTIHSDFVFIVAQPYSCGIDLVERRVIVRKETFWRRLVGTERGNSSNDVGINVEQNKKATV